MSSHSLEARDRRALIALLVLGVVAGVGHFAWASDDAYITFRHVQNVWAGNGPVFNAGERVQGFTHPLWFGILVLGSAVVGDPVLLSYALGLMLTTLTVGWMASRWMEKGVGVPIVVAAVWGTSPSWLQFQTSGLENALSHLLLLWLVREAAVHGTERPFYLTLIWALLGTNRMDFAVACLPTILVLLPTLRTRGKWLGVFAGSLPAVAWACFSLSYYGDLLPNTAHAKVGIFPSIGAALTQGGRYLWDFVSVEPVAACTMFLGLGAGLSSKNTVHRALAAGGLLHIAYVVWVGGDFMRGRFLLAPMVLGTLLGALALGPVPSKGLGVATALLASLGLLTSAIRPRGAEIPPSGILEERSFYPWMHWRVYTRQGPQSPYMKPELLAGLTTYAEVCGPFTIHGSYPGSIATLAGPDVHVIDLLGLTDHTIARLPRSELVWDPPRVGHPYKHVPVRYLAEQGDISLLEGWEEAVLSQDCSFADRLEVLKRSDATYYTGQPLL